MITATLFIALPLALSALHGTEPLVPFGTTWRYLDDGSDQGDLWRAPGFDDAAWPLGAAEFGYGDGDETTTIDYGPDPDDKHITTYFRLAFDVADPGALTGLRLSVVRDDGVIVFLNGTEVLRDNLPDGDVGFDTLTLDSVSLGVESAPITVGLTTDALVVGTNVLAVEIHQASRRTGDMRFDLRLLGLDTPPALLRGAYVQGTTPTSAIIRWNTDLPTSTRLLLGPAPGALIEWAVDPGLRTAHEVLVDGLAPGTTSYYAIGSLDTIYAGDDEDHRFATSPEGGAIRIWVLGDSGTADENAERVRDAFDTFTGEREVDAWLMLGDNAYQDGIDEEFQAAVFDMYTSRLRRTSVWPAFGNHDSRAAHSGSLWGVYYDVFSLPRAAEAGGSPSGTEAFYSFDVGNVHFICIDSDETLLDAAKGMLAWVTTDIAETSADWIIAYWHHPPYSRGSTDSDDPDQAKTIAMREQFLPLLEAAGVDLVLAGHSHSYERSFLLDGHYGVSGELIEEEMILDAGDGDPVGDGPYRKPRRRAAHAGAVYAVVGSSGSTLFGPLDHPVMARSFLELGSLVVDVDGPVLDATFLDDTGNVLDQFRIDRSCVADIDADGTVGFGDIIALVAAWGPCGPLCPADLNGNGEVAFSDLLLILAAWGSCP